MFPYFLLVFLPFLPFIFKFKGRDKDPNNISILIFFIALFCLLAFRSPTIGRDLRNYEVYFQQFGKQSWKSIFSINVEVGYAVLNKVVSVFTSNFQWLLVICALISIIPISIIYYQEIEDSILTISIFVILSNFIMLFSGLRQSIAISFGLMAFLFVKKKKIIPFICMVILAFLFHKSAFILLMMYPLYHLRLNRKSLWIIIPILIIILINKTQVFIFLGNLFDDIYTTSIDETNSFGMLVFLSIFLAYSYIIVDEEKIEHSVYGLRNFLILCVVIQMFASLHTLAMRMGYYYLIYLPLLIPKINTNSLENWKEIAVILRYVMIIFFLCWFFVIAPKTNALDTFPYQFFWKVG